MAEPRGWYFGGQSWKYGNDPMSPLVTDKANGQGGMSVGSDQTTPTLQQIIDALQSHADQAVSPSGEAPVAAEPTSGPPADSLASVTTSQMSPAASVDTGTSGGAEGAPAGDAGAAGDGSGGSGGSGGGSGAGSAMRRGGRVRDRQQPGDPDSDRDMHGRKDYRKVVRHAEGGFSVGRGRR
jgi:hypothetical protein